MIAEVQRPWVKLVLACLPYAVEDVVGREKLMVGYLVALYSITCCADVEDKSSKTSTRYQDSFRVALKCGAGNVMFESMDNRRKSCVSFGQSFSAPLAIQLSYGGASLVQVGGLRGAMPAFVARVNAKLRRTESQDGLSDVRI